jgi:hypothetical protein
MINLECECCSIRATSQQEVTAWADQERFGDLRTYMSSHEDGKKSARFKE